MKHIRRKITVSVLGTMLFVFAVLLATVNIFIPEYLTAEAQKAILLEDERKDPIPLAETTDEGEEHFLASSVRYLEVEEGLTESEHLSKAEYCITAPTSTYRMYEYASSYSSASTCDIRKTNRLPPVFSV